MPAHVITLICPDRHGIVASVAQGLVELDANITESAQFSDATSGTFCMRTVADAPIEEAEDVVAGLADRAADLGATIAVRRLEGCARQLDPHGRQPHPDGCVLHISRYHCEAWEHEMAVRPRVRDVVGR